MIANGEGVKLLLGASTGVGVVDDEALANIELAAAGEVVDDAGEGFDFFNKDMAPEATGVKLAAEAGVAVDPFIGVIAELSAPLLFL